jgi:hypothetical protein
MLTRELVTVSDNLRAQAHPFLLFRQALLIGDPYSSRVASYFTSCIRPSSGPSEKYPPLGAPTRSARTPPASCRTGRSGFCPAFCRRRVILTRAWNPSAARGQIHAPLTDVERLGFWVVGGAGQLLLSAPRRGGRPTIAWAPVTSVAAVWRARADRVWRSFAGPAQDAAATWCIPAPARDAPGGCSLPLALICRLLLGSHVRLARASPRSFARHDRAAQEQFAPPDSPGLPPLQRSGEAGGPRRALPAQGLGQLHVIRRLGEEQLRVICAGQLRTGTRDRQRRGESGCWHALPGRCGRVRSSARSGNLAGVLVRPAPVTLVGPARG